jgi:hypothetical protein
VAGRSFERPNRYSAAARKTFCSTRPRIWRTRWETATYKPSISDLEKLARFFGTPITVFFPQPEPKSRTNALLSATADLDDDNLEEVTLYAQFRRMRQRKKKR